MIERVMLESEKKMFPREYCGKHLAGVNCVYFINQVNTRLYKIGYTKDLKARLRNLSCGSSMHLNPVAWVCIRDPSRLPEAEAMAHKQARLLGEHMRGEWFKLEPAYISAIVTGLMGMRDQVIGVALDEYHEVHSVIEFARRLELEEAGAT